MGNSVDSDPNLHCFLRHVCVNTQSIIYGINTVWKQRGQSAINTQVKLEINIFQWNWKLAHFSEAKWNYIILLQKSFAALLTEMSYTTVLTLIVSINVDKIKCMFHRHDYCHTKGNEYLVYFLSLVMGVVKDDVKLYLKTAKYMCNGTKQSKRTITLAYIWYYEYIYDFNHVDINLWLKIGMYMYSDAERFLHSNQH